MRLSRFSLALVLSVFILSNAISSAEPLWLLQTPDDPAMSLAFAPPISKDASPQLVAGYDSGAVIGFKAAAVAKPEILWTATVDGSVLAVRPLDDINADGFPEIVATTDTGTVACVGAGGPDAGAIRWSLNVVFNLSELVILDDMTGDAVREVAFGGAGHRVHVVNGANGKELWTRFLEAGADVAFVDCLQAAGDLNGDGKCDLFVRTWGANRWAISGVDGSSIWAPQPGSPYLSLLVAASDRNNDGRREFLESGNSGTLSFCNGADGAEIWNCPLGRPLRSVAVVTEQKDDDSGDGKIVCFAGNAEGNVACVDGAMTGAVSVRWTVSVGDVCRGLVVPGDIDKNGTPDVVAGAENGVVSAFSGADGKPLWKCQGPDTVRTMVAVGDVDGDGLSDLAVSFLDGTLALMSARQDKDSALPARAKSERKKPARIRANPAAEPILEAPILLYHDVAPHPLRPGESNPVENFRDQMDLLVKNGYTAVSLEEIAEWMEGKINLPVKPVCITFDGQYSSHNTHLLKILQDRHLFGYSYITTDWIGTANHLDWHELRRCELSGAMDIENHTINHATLSAVSREEVIRQVAEANAAIERHLDGKISKHHTYPNGVHNAVAREVMAEQGFRTATAVLHRRALKADGIYAMPRYTIFETTTLDTFKAIVNHTPPLYPALPYTFAGTVGSGWRQPSYADLGPDGKLWVGDYSANHIRVFLPDGTEAPFSPVTEGLKQNGESMPLRSPSGIAVTPSGEILISISSRFGAIRHSGLFRYRATDGAPLPGIDLPYYPGDVDTDSKGLIYVVDKLTDQWHLYTPEGTEVPGSPFGENTGLSVCRGIAVTPDSKTVYILSESSANVRVWKGSATAASAAYKETGILVNQLSSECGAVDVMNDGTVLVGYHDEGMIVAFDAAGKAIGQISGGTIPSMAAPRGTAFTPDGKILWTVGRFGQIQRWEKTSAP